MFKADERERYDNSDCEKVFQSILEDLPNLTEEEQKAIIRDPFSHVLMSSVEINNNVFPKFLEKMKADLGTMLNKKQDRKAKGKMAKTPKKENPKAKKTLRAGQMLKNLKVKAKSKKEVEEKMEEEQGNLQGAKTSESGTETADSSKTFSDKRDGLSAVSNTTDQSRVDSKEKSDIQEIKSFHDKTNLAEFSKGTESKSDKNSSLESNKKSGKKFKFPDRFNRLLNLNKKSGPRMSSEKKEDADSGDDRTDATRLEKKSFDLEKEKNVEPKRESATILNNKTCDAIDAGEMKNEEKSDDSEEEEETSFDHPVGKQRKAASFHLQLQSISERDESESGEETEEKTTEKEAGKDSEPHRKDRSAKTGKRKEEEEKEKDQDFSSTEEEESDEEIQKKKEKLRFDIGKARSSESLEDGKDDRKKRVSSLQPLAISKNEIGKLWRNERSSLGKYSKHRWESDSDKPEKRKSIAKLHIRSSRKRDKKEIRSDVDRRKIISEENKKDSLKKCEEKKKGEREANDFEEEKKSSKERRKSNRETHRGEEAGDEEDVQKGRKKTEVKEEEEEEEREERRRRRRRRKRRRRRRDSDSDKERRRRSVKEKGKNEVEEKEKYMKNKKMPKKEIKTKETEREKDTRVVKGDRRTKEDNQKKKSLKSEASLKETKKKERDRDKSNEKYDKKRKTQVEMESTQKAKEVSEKPRKVLVILKGHDNEEKSASIELEESGAELKKDLQRYEKIKKEQERKKKKADNEKKKAEEKKKEEHRREEEKKRNKIRKRHERERKEMQRKREMLKKEEAKLISKREDFLQLAQRLLDQSPERKMAERFLQSKDDDFASILHDRLTLKQQLLRAKHQESQFDHVIFEMTKDSEPLDVEAVKKAFSQRHRRRCDACSQPVHRPKHHREFQKDDTGEFLTCEVCSVGLSEAYEHVLRDLQHDRTLNVVLQNWSYADAAEAAKLPQVSGMAAPPYCAGEELLTECLRNVEYEELLKDIADVVVDIKTLLRVNA